MAFSTSEGGDESMVSEINITPLVDVMLVLMVTFILTAPVLNNAVHINLPQTAVTAPPDQTKAMTLSVDGDGNIFLDKRQVQLSDVQGELEKEHKANAEMTLRLQADKKAEYGEVAKVMALIERAGITRLSVLTEQ